ncbi:MAG: hypothetical protein WC869_13700 [Phycisphaerae bacterium]|jgi:hypothetical protein
MDTHTIVGVHLDNRLTEAVEVQKLLTAYGKQIKTRLGLHEVAPSHEPNGLILLEMVDPQQGIKDLMGKLNAIHGVEAQSMVFKHA